MPLIANIQEAQKYLRLRYINANSSMPNFDAVAAKYIVPITGWDLYNSLLLPAPTAVKSALLLLIKQAIVPLAYWHELASLHVQIGDQGLTVQKSENTEAVHRWEFEQLSNSIADKGCAALDTVISYLKDNQLALAWVAPEGFKTLFTSATDFNRYFNTYQPHRTFEALRPIIQQVEDQYIIPSIGEAFLTWLKENASTNLTITATLKKAVANYTIAKSVDLLPVRISTEGFTVSLGFNTDMKQQGQAQAPDTQMSRLVESTKTLGDFYLLQATDLLNTKASSVVYPLYFNSSYYKPPVTQTINRNQSRKSFGF